MLTEYNDSIDLGTLDQLCKFVDLEVSRLASLPAMPHDLARRWQLISESLSRRIVHGNMNAPLDASIPSNANTPAVSEADVSLAYDELRLRILKATEQSKLMHMQFKSLVDAKQVRRALIIDYMLLALAFPVLAVVIALSNC